MKKNILILICVLSNTFNAFSQETWQKTGGDLIGNSTGVDTPGINDGPITMPSVYKLQDGTGTYIMYFNYNNGTENICYATSSDAINWMVSSSPDIALQGSSDLVSNDGKIGGASVIYDESWVTYKYRMYYRSSTIGYTDYKIRGAMSEDGKNFVRTKNFTDEVLSEGDNIIINNHDGNPSSPFAEVAHLSVYSINYTVGASTYKYAALISITPTVTNGGGAPDIYRALSIDGIIWDDDKIELVYTDCHDPKVLQLKDGTYVMYAMDLARSMVVATSNDGVTWNEKADATFSDNDDPSVNMFNTYTQEYSTIYDKRIGDVGGIVMDDGKIYLYTNYSGAYDVDVDADPSYSFVMYTNSNSAKVTVGNVIATSTAICDGQTLEFSSTETGDHYKWIDPNSISSTDHDLSVSNPVTGTYMLQIFNADETIAYSGAIDVIVNENPELSISSNAPLCAGSTLQFYSTLTDPVYPVSYSWTKNISPWASIVAEPSITNASFGENGTYNLTITDGNECQSSSSIDVEVVPIPPQPVVPALITYCSNSNQLLPTSNVTCTRYKWTFPTGSIHYLQHPMLTNIQTGANGNYFLQAQNLDILGTLECSSSGALMQVLVNATPATPTGVGNTGLGIPAGGYFIGDPIDLVFTGPAPPTVAIEWIGPNAYSSNVRFPRIPAANHLTEGVYSVRLNHPNGCSSPFVETCVSVLGTGATPCGTASKGISEADEISIESKNTTFEIFPNPSNGVFVLNTFLEENSNAKLEIKNIIGQIIYSSDLSTHVGNYSSEIKLAEANKGIYFVSLSNGTQKITKKIVIN